VLTAIRGETGLPLTLECGSRVGLFMYDNNTFIIQSFKEQTELVKLRFGRPGVKLTKLAGIGTLPGVGKPSLAEPSRQKTDETVFEVPLFPGRYMVFRYE
jgi:hypothetical protein